MSFSDLRQRLPSPINTPQTVPREGLKTRLVEVDPNRGPKPKLSVTMRFLPWWTEVTGRKKQMKSLTIFAALMASPALAHSGTAVGHVPHVAYLVAVLALGVALAARNALKG